MLEQIEHEIHIKPDDLEVILFEIPKSNWEIGGIMGDEKQLDYEVDV